MQRKPGPSKRSGAPADPAVDEFLNGLNHPLKREIVAVRGIVLGVDPSIRDGIKWNSLSFRTSDWFATVHLRSPESLRLIFHTGAKVKATARSGVKVADPEGLMEWLAKDRCMITLGTGKEIAKNRKAFEAIVREWIRAV